MDLVMIQNKQADWLLTNLYCGCTSWLKVAAELIQKSAETFCLSFIMQQDDNRKHTANKKVLNWLSQSLDARLELS